MIKKIFGLMIFSAIVISCGNNTGNKNAEATEGDGAAVVVEFAGLIENPAQFENKDITISGKVVHVCTMSGKKMFIVGENPDIRLFITASDDIPKFPMELLGSEITVTGTLALVEPGEKGEGEHAEGEMAEGEMAEAEGEAAEMAEAAETGENCETEEALAKQPVLSEYVLHYKSHIVK